MATVRATPERELPFDVLCHTLQYLQLTEDHAALTLVCRLWYFATYDPRVWPDKAVALRRQYALAARPTALRLGAKATQLLDASIIGAFGIVTYTPIVLVHFLHRRQFPLPILAPLIVQYTCGGYTEMQVWRRLGFWAFSCAIGLLFFGSLILPKALEHPHITVGEHTVILLLSAVAYFVAVVVLNLRHPGWLNPGHVFTHPMVGMTLAYPLSFLWMSISSRDYSFLFLLLGAVCLAIGLLKPGIRLASVLQPKAEHWHDLPARIIACLVDTHHRRRCPDFGCAVAPPVVYTVAI